MWRLYGGGEGIALGFETSKIIEATERIQKEVAIHTIYVERVLYGFNDAMLAKRVLDAPEVTQKFAENIGLMLRGQKEGPEVTRGAFWKFVVLTCGAKLPDFSDEREIRLVVAEEGEGRENGRQRAPQVEPGKIVVKYLEALRSIMIGPGDGQEAKAERVRRTLDRYGFQQVEITKSNTQFRFVRPTGPASRTTG